MSHPNTNDFSRESYESPTLIHIRYAGNCRDCGKPIQATVTKTPAEKKPAEWVRCSDPDCRSITRCGQSGTATPEGVGSGGQS